MKKNTIAAMAAALLCACVSSGTFAADIPASISGDYVGSGWNCRVLAFATAAAPATHRSLEAQCTGPDNRQRLSTAVWLGCPQTGAAIPLYAQAGAPTNTPNLAIHSVEANLLLVTINGSALILGRAQPVPSPAPFSGCGAALPQPPALPRYCVVYGCD